MPVTINERKSDQPESSFHRIGGGRGVPAKQLLIEQEELLKAIQRCCPDCEQPLTEDQYDYVPYFGRMVMFVHKSHWSNCIPTERTLRRWEDSAAKYWRERAAQQVTED